MSCELPIDKSLAKKKWSCVCEQIRSRKRYFSHEKLFRSECYTRHHAAGIGGNDSACSSRSRNGEPINGQRQWMLASKFIIATQYQMATISTLIGVNTNHFPNHTDIVFFVDHQQNICAALSTNDNRDDHDDEEEKEDTIANASATPANILFCRNLINHCERLSVVAIDRFDGIHQRQQPLSSSSSRSRYVWQPQHPSSIYIIRVPISFYYRHLDGSFYEFCCMLTQHLLTHKTYTHPLFTVFMNTLAHFDCFQMSLPVIPLSGDIDEMRKRFMVGCGDGNSDRQALSFEQDLHFIACFRQWRDMKLNCARRQCLYSLVNNESTISLDLMTIVIHFAGFANQTPRTVLTAMQTMVDSWEFEEHA